MSMNRRKFVRNLLVSGASVPVLTACGGSSSTQEAAEVLPGAPEDNLHIPDEPAVVHQPTEELRFMVIGDMGTGGLGQYQVGAAMAALAAEQGCDFVLGTGDNIYEDGVRSVEDRRFLEMFEYPYQNLDVPFYMCLGNHDCASTPFGGGSDNKRGDHQVAYHYTRNRYSNKWQMPGRYYRQPLGELSATRPFMELFAVDSNPLTSFYPDLDPNFSWRNYGYPQQQWMRQAVRQSKAHWKIAFSHVPYLSNGKHGNAGNLDPGMRWLFTSPDADGQRYKAFMEDAFAHQVDLIFTGHDHSLQWLQPAPAMGPAAIIVSGAGGKKDKFDDANRNPAVFQQENSLGFVWVKLTMETMTIEFHAVSDSGVRQLIHRQEVVKPIAASAAVPA
ncbi:MAG: metallophosphoesterase [Marinobacter sp.]|nr:metallophosphoesterase [Marinobacter sp.]